MNQQHKALLLGGSNWSPSATRRDRRHGEQKGTVPQFHFAKARLRVRRTFGAHQRPAGFALAVWCSALLSAPIKWFSAPYQFGGHPADMDEPIPLTDPKTASEASTKPYELAGFREIDAECRRVRKTVPFVWNVDSAVQKACDRQHGPPICFSRRRWIVHCSDPDIERKLNRVMAVVDTNRLDLGVVESVRKLVGNFEDRHSVGRLTHCRSAASGAPSCRIGLVHSRRSSAAAAVGLNPPAA